MKSGNDVYRKIADAFDKKIDLFNSEVGWTVYGWGKRGLIGDFSILVDDIKDPGDNKFPSQDITTHVLHLHPSNKYYLGLSKIHGRPLDNLKFDFSTL